MKNGNRMKPEVRAMWVAALRSGEYEQATDALSVAGGGATPPAFCCLGVLCDLHGRETGNLWTEDDSGLGPRRYLGASGRLPSSVMAWSGLQECNPSVPVPFGRDGHATLATLNDGMPGIIESQTFEQVAAVIEEHL